VHESTIFSFPRPPALPTLVQYYCTIIGQYKPLPTYCLYAILHTILVMAISCKGQVALWPRANPNRRMEPVRIPGEELSGFGYVVLKPLQEIVPLQRFLVGVNYPFIVPSPLVKPTLLQYDCTTIVQYTPPHRPPFCMPYTIQYWWW